MSPQVSQDSIDTTAMRLQSMLARAIHAIRKELPAPSFAEVFHSQDFQTVFVVMTGSGEKTRDYIAYLQRVREGKLYTFGVRLDFSDAYEDVHNSLMRAQLEFAREVDGLHP